MDYLLRVHVYCLFYQLGPIRESSQHKVTNLKFNTNSAQMHFIDLTVTQNSVCPSNYVGYNTIIFIMHVLLPESEL